MDLYKRAKNIGAVRLEEQIEYATTVPLWYLRVPDFCSFVACFGTAVLLQSRLLGVVEVDGKTFSESLADHETLSTFLPGITKR